MESSTWNQASLRGFSTVLGTARSVIDKNPTPPRYSFVYCFCLQIEMELKGTFAFARSDSDDEPAKFSPQNSGAVLPCLLAIPGGARRGNGHRRFVGEIPAARHPAPS